MQEDQANQEVVQEVQTSEQRDGNTTVERQSIRRSETVPSSVVAKRIVWLVVGFLLAMLALRVLLFLLGADASSGFVDFIYSFTGVFTAPFNGIFPVPEYGRFGIDSAAIIAMIIYALVGWGIGAILDLGKPAGTSSVD